jgi:hypothetical protein
MHQETYQPLPRNNAPAGGIPGCILNFGLCSICLIHIVFVLSGGGGEGSGGVDLLAHKLRLYLT